MLVVDTNVLAYLLLQGARTAESRALLEADADWRSEQFMLVEFTNVLATAVRAGRLPAARAQIALEEAQALMEPGLCEAPHADVLALAIQLKVTAYDARFLTVANTLGVKLVTEDTKLRKAAPKLTQSLADALAAL